MLQYFLIFCLLVTVTFADSYCSNSKDQIKPFYYKLGRFDGYKSGGIDIKQGEIKQYEELDKMDYYNLTPLDSVFVESRMPDWKVVDPACPQAGIPFCPTLRTTWVCEL